MGSSKKHKHDKDKKKRHRSKSRSRSVEEDGGGRSRSERERPRDPRKRRHEEAEYSQPSKKHHSEKNAETSKTEIGNAASSGGSQQESLSIEETNKLRAKLGLKPLEVTEGPKEPALSEEGHKKYIGRDDGEEFTHVPAQNISEQKKTEEIREKMLLIREKRLLNQKLGKVKKIASEKDDDASAWVAKLRKQQTDKEKAAHRERMLQEMDQEFGVGNLVETEMKIDKEKRKNQAYMSHNLKGLKVGHTKEFLEEGQSVILTLEDKRVLDDDEEDTLVNVNVVDREKSAKNIERKKQKPAYNPYSNVDDFDDFGEFKPKSILDKYNEEIDGEKKDSFRLDKGGIVGMKHEKQIQNIKTELRQRAESLESKPLVMASEYYTEAEMISFKKPKLAKKKKLRKRVVLKADDLLADNKGIPGLDLVDHGSRKKKKAGKVEDMDIEAIPESSKAEILGPEEDLTGVQVEVEDTEREQERALKKARKWRQAKPKGIDKIAKEIARAPRKHEIEDSEDEDELGIDLKQKALGNITLNQTSEFCRTLGDIPTYGMAGNREDLDEDELMDFERELMEERQKQIEKEQTEKLRPAGWEEVNIDDEPTEIKEEDKHFLDEEPELTRGIAGALKLAANKGYLEQKINKVEGAQLTKAELEAQHFTVEDKQYDIDDKFKQRDRFSAGPITDFRDKEKYAPGFKLEYADETGRLMNPKEAFRYLSHRFHGKMSGKTKLDKRSKKLQEEELMKKMSSTDTPLNTLGRLKEKQKQTKSAYVVLSGSKIGMNVNTIAKPRPK